MPVPRACHAHATRTWQAHATGMPARPSAHAQVFFELRVSLEKATVALGDTLEGFACCGQYKYYAFPQVEERVAPSVDFQLTSGQIKALYWRYDTCPIETEHVVDGRCRGWCVLDWYRLYSGNLGVPRYRYQSTLAVPLGLGEAPDKRRGGRWYLGVQALDGPAEYTAVTSTEAPRSTVDDGCSRLDRYCPTADRYRSMWQSAAPRRRRPTSVAFAPGLLGGALGAVVLAAGRLLPYGHANMRRLAELRPSPSEADGRS